MDDKSGTAAPGSKLQPAAETCVLTWDKDGKVMWANKAARILFGMTSGTEPVRVDTLTGHPIMAAATAQKVGPESRCFQAGSYDVQLIPEEDGVMLIAWPQTQDLPPPAVGSAELNRLYERIIESSEDMIAIIGPDLRYIGTNKRYAEHHGCRLEDLPGTSIADIAGPKLTPLIAERVALTLRGETLNLEENKILSPHKKQVLSIQYRPFWYFGDVITAAILTLRDITLERDTEEAIRESEARYRELFNAMSSGVAVYEVIGDGDDFIFKDMNPAGCRLGQLNKADILGRSVTKTYPAIHDMGLFEVFQRVYRTGTAEQVPLTLYEDSRIQQWVDNFIYRLPNGDIVAIYADVTDRMVTLESLNIRDRALASASNAVIITEARHDMPIVYVNAAFEKMTGYTAGEVLGKNARFLQSLDRNQPEIDTIRTALRAGEPCTVTLRNYTKGGQAFIAKVSISPVKNHRGELTHFIGVQEDITQATKMQKELLQAQKMEVLGQLSGGIAHDFNNVLASMMGFADLASRFSQNHANPKVVSYLNHVLEGGRRAQGLIAQLMVFSRPQPESQALTEVDREIVDFTSLLRSSLPTSIDIQIDIEQNLPRAKLQSVQFDQILMNLAVNARDAMDGCGTLTIQLHTKTFTHQECTACHEDLRGNWLVLSVTDTGSGIDPKLIETIFEPFFTTKESGHGTGLGLSVTHRIICAQGGHVLVESELGKGSTFHVLLPSEAVEPASSTDSATKASAQMLKGQAEHILVVDDEPALTEYLSELLLSSGYRATAVNSAREAEAMLQDKPDDFDLLIADQTMPDLTGTELIASAHHCAPNLPVILCTGNSQQIEDEALKSGQIDLLLNKPLYGDYFLAQVQALLKKQKYHLKSAR
ncbi:MAG: PAS domain-containing protein [Thiotrichales bacterium]